MNITLVSDWYLATDKLMGSTDVNYAEPNSYMTHNADKIYSYLTSEGFTVNAISAMLGNMQVESTINPALIQDTNRWRLPNSGAELSDVPNSVMQNFYDEYYGLSSGGFGISLVQWDGKGITRQKYVGFCINNNLIWYEGNSALARLIDEKDRNLQFQTVTIGGVAYNWSNFPYSTASPEDLAEAWRAGYERSVYTPENKARRQRNARWWYEYLTGEPPTPPDPPDPPDPPEPPEPTILPAWYYMLLYRRRNKKEVILR